MKRPILIAYDVSDPKRLYRTLKILKRWRLDGQKSIHECLMTPEQVAALKSELAVVMNEDEDKLLMVWLDGQRPIESLGTGRGLRLFKNYFHVR